MTEKIKVIPTNGTSADDVKYAKRVEEIYIDGVNVSNCEFIGNIKNGFVICTSWVHNNKKSENGHWDCRVNKNCYYKQIKRLEQENKDFEILAKSLYKRIEELEKENEALAFRERLYKADYEASEQENKELKEKLDKEEYNSCCECTNIQNQNDEYRSALEEIREILNSECGIISNAKAVGIINEVLECE